MIQIGLVGAGTMGNTHNRAYRQMDGARIAAVCDIDAAKADRIAQGWDAPVFTSLQEVADIMRWMLQSEVREVYAEIDTLLHDIPVEDCGLLSMKFDNGVIATLDTSWSRPSTFSTWGDVTMRIVGLKGVIHLDAFAQAGSLWESSGSTTHKVVGWGDSSNGALVGEFVDSIRTGREPSITGVDGLRAAEVAWAAYESAKIGKPMPMKHY